MKSLYTFISRQRRNFVGRQLSPFVNYLWNALENKNNDHHTNGEFWLMKQLSKLNINTVFDVGANIGKWADQANTMFPNASIYAFEPVPDTFKCLKSNTYVYQRIKAINAALSNSKGTIAMNYYSNRTICSSIYHHPQGGESVTVQVDCVDGDSFCEIENIKTIDFLKIDAEGAEHLILQGFEKMLQSQKIKVIQFEYGIFSIDTKFLLKDFYQLFLKNNYKVGKVFPNHVHFCDYSWKLENFIGPNYLAVKADEKDIIKLLT